MMSAGLKRGYQVNGNTIESEATLSFEQDADLSGCNLEIGGYLMMTDAKSVVVDNLKAEGISVDSYSYSDVVQLKANKIVVDEAVYWSIRSGTIDATSLTAGGRITLYDGKITISDLLDTSGDVIVSSGQLKVGSINAKNIRVQSSAKMYVTNGDATATESIGVLYYVGNGSLSAGATMEVSGTVKAPIVRIQNKSTFKAGSVDSSDYTCSSVSTCSPAP